MRSNPFYAMSASAMLLGCWLLGEALELEAGKLAGLMLLMLVLQLYELLLTGLGAHLVRSGRAPRDGVIVLALASVFLMNATSLSAECVTTDFGLGAAAAVAAGVLGVLRLGWVRRRAPELLSGGAAVALGAHAVFILAVPVVAAQLAAARLMGPAALYVLWWATAALPIARSFLLAGTSARPGRASVAHARWAWMPASMVLLHLWQAGYIHSVGFRLAFLGPFLLGLALTARPEEQGKKLALPLAAVFFSLLTGWDLKVHLLGFAVSAARLALAAGALAWVYLGWRDRDPWLAGLPIGGAAVWLLGPHALTLAEIVARLVAGALPRDRFGWGTLTVIAAFVLLAAGLRRSLHAERR